MTFAGISPQLFAHAAVVIGDQGVGGFENMTGGAIVLLQLDHLMAGVMLLEIENIFYLCTTPAVDRLIIVADHKQVVIALG